MVNRTGPWDNADLAPPTAGNERVSFLASDGLYVGQGKFEDLERDVLGGAILNPATKLRVAITSLTTRH